MILGAGWAFLGLVAVGLAALVLVPGCGLVVTGKAPPGRVSLDAPSLVEPDPAVEAKAAAVATLSLARAKRQVGRAAIRIRNTACAGVRSGSGFALDSRLLVAGEDVVPGAGALTVASRNAAAKTVDASRVYRLGQLAIARVEGGLPPAGAAGASTASGASVAVVGYPLSSAPRLLPGVVVDTVAGTRFGVPGPVMRLTTVLRDDDPGGPVIDAKGRVVGVAFTTDPTTGLAVAAPIATLRSAIAARALEVPSRCGH